MDKQKYLEVLKEITEQAQMAHSWKNFQSDYPCKDNDHCDMCKAITEAQDLIWKIETEDA